MRDKGVCTGETECPSVYEVSQLTFEQEQLLPQKGRKGKIERVDTKIKCRIENHGNNTDKPPQLQTMAFPVLKESVLHLKITQD